MHSPPHYRILPHTADLAIEAFGKDWPGLLCHAGEGLIASFADRRYIRGREQRQVEVTGTGKEETLVAWLSEWLYLFDAEGFLPRLFRIEKATETGVAGYGMGEPFDGNRHVILTQVKAVTYHQVSVEHQLEIWRSFVVLDI